MAGIGWHQGCVALLHTESAELMSGQNANDHADELITAVRIRKGWGLIARGARTITPRTAKIAVGTYRIMSGPPCPKTPSTVKIAVRLHCNDLPGDLLETPRLAPIPVEAHCNDLPGDHAETTPLAPIPVRPKSGSPVRAKGKLPGGPGSGQGKSLGDRKSKLPGGTKREFPRTPGDAKSKLPGCRKRRTPVPKEENTCAERGEHLCRKRRTPVPKMKSGPGTPETKKENARIHLCRKRRTPETKKGEGANTPETKKENTCAERGEHLKQKRRTPVPKEEEQRKHTWGTKSKSLGGTKSKLPRSTKSDQGKSLFAPRSESHAGAAGDEIDEPDVYR
jgi:hypothetical protein